MAIRLTVVDDDIDVCNSVEMLLRPVAGISFVGSYASAKEALAQLPTVNPDVILLDILMPGMNGVDCLRHLRARSSAWKIIMLTACSDYSTMAQTRALGANGFLVKPFRPDFLIGAIHFSLLGGYPVSEEVWRQMPMMPRTRDRAGSPVPRWIRLVLPGSVDQSGCAEPPVLSAIAKAARYHVDELAKLCHLPVRKLERHFQDHIKESPRRWLRKFRMTEAVRLLENGYSIKQVADQLGFAQSASFYREFHRFFRRSASEYSAHLSVVARPAERKRTASRKSARRK
jgi:DNA-binding NarL/FixJ family response regulator